MKQLKWLAIILGLACQMAGYVDGLIKHVHSITTMVSGAINYLCLRTMTTSTRMTAVV